MSSLRLALKQSLAETGTLVNEEQKERERKRKKELARKRREQQRLLQQARKQKKRGGRKSSRPDNEDNDSDSSSDDDDDDDESSLSSSSSSGSSSGSDDSSTSSGDSDSSSGDEDDSSSDDSSDDDSSSSSSSSAEAANVDMGGVFDTEQSSSDEEGDRRNKKLQKRGRGGQRGKSPSKKGGVRKRKNIRGGSVSSSQKKKSGGGGGGGGNKKSSGSKQQICVPPDPAIIAYVRQMPILEQRKSVERGLRVKVRFVTKSSKKGKDGKAIRKLRWYGGVVTDIATGGKRIRIKYDDGTSEVADFPDKDIVVDNVGNGQHKHGTKPEAFLPPTPQKRRTPSPRAPLSGEFEKKVEKPKPRRNSSENRTDLTTDEIAQLKRLKQQKRQKSTSSSVGDKEHKQARKTAAGHASTGTVDKKRTTPVPLDDGTPKSQKAKRDTVVAAVAAVTSPAAAAAADKIRPPSSPSSSSASSSSDSSSSPSEAEKNKKKKKKEKVAVKRKRKRSLTPEVPTTVATKPKKKPKDATELALERAAARLEGKGSSMPFSGSKKSDVAMTDNAAKETRDREPESDNTKKESTDFPLRVVTSDSVDGAVISESIVASSKKRALSPSAVDAAGEPPSKKASTEDKAADEKRMQLPTSTIRKKTDAAHDTEVVPAESSSAFTSYKEKKIAPASPTDTNNKELTTGKPAEVEVTAGAKTEISAIERKTLTTDDDAAGSMKKESDCKPVSVKETSDASQSNKSKDLSKSLPSIGNKEAAKAAGAAQVEDKHDTDSRTPPPEEDSRRSPGPSPKDISKPNKKVPLPPVQRSGRRAAQKANELIVAKEERIIKDADLKRKVVKKKEDLKIRRSSDDDVDDDDLSNVEDDHWVSCDRCSKWRLLPSMVNMDALPERWFCEMNTYDPKRNTCEALEQSTQEAAAEKKKKAKEAKKTKKLASSSPRPPKSSSKSPILDAAKNEVTAVESKQIVDEKDSTAIDRRPSGQKGKRRSPPTVEPTVARGSSDKATASSTRPRADGNSEDGMNLPGTSTQTKKSRQRSGDGDAAEAASASAAVPGRSEASADAAASAQASKQKASSRSRNKGKSGKDSEKEKKSSKSKKGSKKSKNDDDDEDPDNVEWVQCEKCEKWRKLPPDISAEDLPEVWYCNMNTWDPGTASCGAKEDKMDSSHREFQIMGEGGTFTTSFGSSGKLSYRNLIFGTKGKQNRPLSERQRAADSLFSYQPLDPLGMAAGPPACLYSTSSAFFHRGYNQQKAAAEEANRVSFFDIMSQSRLWDELYRGARKMQSLPLNEENSDGPASTHVGSMSEEMYVRSMKALIYHALGTKTLAGDEVLLEAQCRQWDDAQWAELRASCTIEVVTHALSLLAKDGLVQVTTDAATGTAQYRRTNIDGLPRSDGTFTTGSAAPAAVAAADGTADAEGNGNRVNTKKQESRCMKISKPWKRNISLA